MSDSFRAQIYNTLISKETDDLLEIWQKGDINEWSEEVFEIVKEILLERLGRVPAQSIQIQVTQVLSNVEKYLENDELSKALRECEHAIQMKPDVAIAYNYRGEIYEEMGQLENTMTNYQTAIQLDPRLKVAWKNLLIAEKDFEKQFQGSTAKKHLDQAFEYTLNDKPEKALKECEAAKSTMPNIAFAHNYLGMILEELKQLEPAIESYLKAIQFNPRFYAARENLANARIRLEKEKYRLVAIGGEANTKIDRSQALKIKRNDAPIPQWLYMDEKAFLLVGWAGHRTRQGRSGYDPLDTDFEYAHMQGVIIRLLITRKFRTRNLFYLIFMTYVGLVYCLPLLGVPGLFQGDWISFLITILYSPYWIVGLALLINVVSSLRLKQPNGYDENGRTFF